MHIYGDMVLVKHMLLAGGKFKSTYRDEVNSLNYIFFFDERIKK